MRPITPGKLISFSPVAREMIQLITAAVCQYNGITFEELMQKSNAGQIVLRRQMLFYLLIETGELKAHNLAPVYNLYQSNIHYSHSQIQDKKTIYKQIQKALAAIITIVNSYEKLYDWKLEA